MRWLLFAGSMFGAMLSLASCDDDDDGYPGGNADIVSCEGSCYCDPEIDTCYCQGGSTCDAHCDGPCTQVCEGNARCDIVCPANCTVECPGTAGCDAAVGDDSGGVCNGTGDCVFTCEGDCSFDCPGVSRCVVHCAPGASCAITSCPMVEDCGDGVLACRTACPS